MPLVEQLQQCAGRSYAPFHTPGHKRGKGVSAEFRSLLGEAAFCADLPELPELDNLFNPEGVIQQAQALAAEAFGADRTYFLANGSTAGLLAAILATCRPGDKVILPRNVHRSVISGLILAGAVPVFVLPDYDSAVDIAHGVAPSTIAQALAAHPDSQAVLLVSPTYYGTCSDVAAIAQLVHQWGLPLIVDEAHGAHFAFHPALPIAALRAGADLVVQSTHKTLAALTQASMLHLQGDRVSPDRIAQALQLVQSTSPNYLLLASLDAARMQMATQGQALLDRTLHLANDARSRIAQIPGLQVLGIDRATTPGFVALDATRLTVIVTGLGIDGFAADEILHQELGVTCELPSMHHLTFIITPGNSQADLDRLVTALDTLSQRCRAAAQVTSARSLPTFPTTNLQHPTAYSPRDAFFAPSQKCAIAEAIGYPSAELVCPYPPGIPVLMPGEMITTAAIEYLQHIQAIGGFITGNSDPELNYLQVIMEK
ncbi:aminotransferase class I/II-fold pyridoxal phosphate-dependent enzyme [Alkalinema sp. FACHB-956]|uniref:aminotransferase class I/II-fold pyridoxal phosphate-dependent enzyme n=1 Tax=Alkalinema sp. FACHB-956 TaxID=2692768 RepID=UPI001684DD4B|nr:aminotransferase class I/II-fold pyridoxal phosphate-dependent enzyme [Alkalinema sp. FACHB-956]